MRYITVKNTKNGWRAVVVRHGLFSKRYKNLSPCYKHRQHACNDALSACEKMQLPIIF